jgi:Tol biopolymer transport system component
MLGTDHSEIRAELGKVLSSPLFVNSWRMSRFLRFIVETTLEGDGERIKEYLVATEVFDKPVDYDPQSDSTVRTEAGKLRSRLARYYDSEGREDPVVITIPKGSYVPHFEIRSSAPVPCGVPSAPTAPARAAFRWPTAFVILVTAACAATGGLLWRSRSLPAPPPSRLIPLTSYPGVEEQPSLSPDGSQVAFRWKGDIYVKPVGAEMVAQLTKSPALESRPAWSPDGTQIAFVRNGDVFLVSPIGGPERKVAESAGRVAWTPDGSSLLVLQKSSPFGVQSVYRVSIATGEKKRLTFPRDVSVGDVDMAMSADGRTLAFCRAETPAWSDLFLLPAAGGEPRRLTNDLRHIKGFAWTADGREIVFASDRKDRFQLWRVAARPSGATGSYPTPVLVEGAGDDARNPSISRTSKLVYQRYSPNLDIRQVEIVREQGARTHHLGPSAPLIASTQIDGMPSWSPDGNTIAFISNRSGTYELWLCAADGTSPLKLTSFGGPMVLFPHWSQDGRRLIFNALTGPDANFEGYIIDAKGGPPQRIGATGHRTMAFPVFSRDARWIYFVPATQDGDVEVFRMPAEGGKAVQITRNGALRLEESPNGRLLFYGKYGKRGLWSIPVTGGEERQVLSSVEGMNWTVASDGIYYFDSSVKPDAPKLLKFYSFKKGNVNLVGTLEAALPLSSPDVSVSPDGRRLLYSHIANTNSDLMILDHFR